jgi:hypothetical protein
MQYASLLEVMHIYSGLLFDIYQQRQYNATHPPVNLMHSQGDPVNGMEWRGK